MSRCIKYIGKFIKKIGKYRYNQSVSGHLRVDTIDFLNKKAIGRFSFFEAFIGTWLEL